MSSSTEANGKRENTVMLAALASALAIPGVPVLLVLAFLVDHIASFRGTCGPYPTDIPAYACGFGEYLVSFASPFAMAGLFGLSIVAAMLTTVLLLLVWALAAIAWALRRTRRSSSGDLSHVGSHARASERFLRAHPRHVRVSSAHSAPTAARWNRMASRGTRHVRDRA